MNNNSIRCDVLVIGGGAAGIRAAIEASDRGTEVLLVSKKKQGYCGSTFYPQSMPWGILKADPDENDQENFYNEICKTSFGCINERLAQIMVRDSNDRFEDLLRYGIRFEFLKDRKETPCFGKKSRGAQLNNLENARMSFENEIRKRRVKVMDNVTIIDLNVYENICYGAVGICNNGDELIIYSKATIMATGGAEYLWKHSLVTSDLSGNGYAMALKHNARLTNMEFIQFIPGSVSPVAAINFHHLTLSSLPKVLNHLGEEFLHKYLPEGISLQKCLSERASHGPFSVEDDSKYFDIGICLEEPDSCYCKGAEIIYREDYYDDPKHKLWIEFLLSKGINTQEIPLRIYPHAQGFNGGIVIDEKCHTDIENLYACGECAGGPHGANRMGGNAILATQVFGKISGEYAAKTAMQFENSTRPNLKYEDKEAEYDIGSCSLLKPEEVITGIKTIMHTGAGIIREEDILQKSIQDIRDMKASFNPATYFFDATNKCKAINAFYTLNIAEIILCSMLSRRESRGGHYRSDYPQKSNKFARMKYVCKNDLVLP